MHVSVNILLSDDANLASLVIAKRSDGVRVKGLQADENGASIIYADGSTAPVPDDAEAAALEAAARHMLVVRETDAETGEDLGIEYRIQPDASNEADVAPGMM